MAKETEQAQDEPLENLSTDTVDAPENPNTYRPVILVRYSPTSGEFGITRLARMDEALASLDRYEGYGVAGAVIDLAELWGSGPEKAVTFGGLTPVTRA